MDIGVETCLAFLKRIERRAHMIIWNGPMGVFEEPPFDQGTIGVAHAVAEAADQGATVIVGGGDSVSAVTQRWSRRSNHPHFNWRRCNAWSFWLARNCRE
jgi:phosphoglycerate kinase